MTSYSKTVIRAIVARKRMSGHVSLNTAAKRAIDSSFFIAEKCLAQDFKSLAQDHISFVTYLSLTCYLPLKFCVILYCLIRISEYKKTPETRCFRGMSLFCNIRLNYLLLNCGALRAALRPYFLRSFIRGSRVR